MIRVQSPAFLKIFICNTILQLSATAIITAATTVLPFCFQGKRRGGFTFAKTFFECCFIRSTHPEVSFNEIWKVSKSGFIERFSFNIAVLNIFGKFLEKHQQQSLFIFSLFMSFQHALSPKWFSRNFPNIFRTTQLAEGFQLHLIIPNDFQIIF